MDSQSKEARLTSFPDEVRGNNSAGVPGPLLSSREADSGRAPLAFAQQRLWFLELLEPNHPAYRSTIGVEFKGPLSVDILRRSMEWLTQRHEPLRTVFIEVNGSPEQLVRGDCTLPFSVVDCPWNERELQRTVAAISSLPMSISDGPLFRATVLRPAAGADIHWLILTLHHLIADGWSFAIFVRELGSIYKALSSDREPDLPTLPLQYRDYAVWQREWLQGPRLQKLLQYWRLELEGMRPLQLPTDYPRPQKAAHGGDSVELRFDEKLTERLEKMAQQQKVTLFMLLLTGFQIALARYTGQDDIVVGCDISNRNLEETEGLIGFFVNQIALRTRIDLDEPFGGLLRRTRRCCFEAYQHRDLPFERLVQELGPERVPGRSSLFEVKFGMRNLPSSDWQIPGLEVRSLRFRSPTSQLDLNVNVFQEGKQITATARYDPALYRKETIRMWLEGWREMFTCVDVLTPVRELIQPGDQERRWLASVNPPPAHPRWNDLLVPLASQAAVEPDRIAVVEADGTRWSYGKIWERAEGLAARLRQLGAEGDIRIGLLLGRTASLIVGMLAVWRLGAAYLPLDSSQPQQRLQWLIDDSGARLLIGDGQKPTWVPDHVTFVDVHSAGGVFDEIGSCSESLAYVLYTSGSSGKPKPVAVQRSGVLNFIQSMAEPPGPQREDIVLAVTPEWFDISVLELICPLAVGAQIVIAGRKTAESGEAPLLWLREQATWFQATPSTWRMIEACGGISGGRLLSGGEVLSGELSQRLRSRGVELWNLYGPTEMTIWSTAHRCSEMDGASHPAIGRPVANTNAYVLNKQGELAGAGARGELYLGGKGVACGYLNRPALTAEQFVPDSFSGVAGSRMYKTGDCVRWRSDGELEFLGRVDEQVKLRGHRIEPAEIESLLQLQPGIKQAAVVVQEYGTDDRRLVAFVCGTAELRIDQMHHCMAEQLPDYMRPWAIVVLDAMPLTANAKLDRRALEKRHVGPASTKTEAALTEKIISGIWAQVLGKEDLEADSNFFEAGGNSFLAVQVALRIKEALGIVLNPAAIFEHATAGALAAHLKQGPSQSQQRRLPTIVPRRRWSKSPLAEP